MLPARNLIAWPTVPSMFCGGDRNFKRGDGSEDTAVAVLVLCRTCLFNFSPLCRWKAGSFFPRPSVWTWASLIR